MSEKMLLNSDNLRVAAEEYNKNFKYFMDNYEQIKSSCKGKFVSVHNGRIYTSDDHENLLKILKAEGIANTDSAYKTYIPETDDVIMMQLKRM